MAGSTSLAGPGLASASPPDDQVAYQRWIAEHDTPSAHALSCLPVLEGPRVSLAMAVGDTDTEIALRSVDSLRRQVYRNWELVLAARPISDWPRRTLAELAQAEPRVRLVGAELGTPRSALLARA